jgi:hypothetical protein
VPATAPSTGLLAPELREGGNEVVAMDLPCEEESAGLSDYADAVIKAVGNWTELILVAQSLAGFTAPGLRTSPGPADGAGAPDGPHAW